jgi:hypothetical protein
MATIVSCYYLIPNNKKRSIPDYMTWITNFLTFCDTPIVMFSDGPIADEMDRIRHATFPTKWLLIRRPLDQLHFSSPEYMTYFAALETHRPRGITADVVKIWMNKTIFLNEVITKNPFNTNSFLWCDAGCWRNTSLASRYAPGWPRNPPSTLSMTWIDTLAEVRAIIRQGRPESLEDCVKRYSLILTKPSVAGAIFGGSAEALQALAEVFPKVLDILMKSKIYMDGDQEILAFSAIWLQQIIPVDLYDKFRHMPEGTDEWFLFQTIL